MLLGSDPNVDVAKPRWILLTLRFCELILEMSTANAEDDARHGTARQRAHADGKLFIDQILLHVRSYM